MLLMRKYLANEADSDTDGLDERFNHSHQPEMVALIESSSGETRCLKRPLSHDNTLRGLPAAKKLNN